MPTKIEWTEETWNPVTGCTPVSEACQNCYAKRIAKRFGWDFSKVALHPDRLEIPLKRQKPTTYFVPSMGDLFHEDVAGGFVEDVWITMHKATSHTFQVLTKRPERMRALLTDSLMGYYGRNPLPNVWLGVSVENQARADERIPLLLATPAAVRFVSCEPLLGPLDFHGSRWLFNRDHLAASFGNPSIDWVIVGGESGGPPERQLIERWGHSSWHPKPEAREWVRSILRQAQGAGVPFFFKQWGGSTPKFGGRLLDGREWSEMPGSP